MRPSNSIPTTAPLLGPNCGAALDDCPSPASAIPKISAQETDQALVHEERIRILPPIKRSILRRMCNTLANGCPDVCPGKQRGRTEKVPRSLQGRRECLGSCGRLFCEWRTRLFAGLNGEGYRPGTQIYLAAEISTLCCSVLTLKPRSSPFFFRLRGVVNVRMYWLWSTISSCSRYGVKEMGVSSPWKKASPPVPSAICARLLWP